MKLIGYALALTMTVAATTGFAETKAAAKKPAAGSASAMKIDPALSTVKWEGSKKVVNDKHSGTIMVKSGTIETKGEMVTGGNVEIDMTTIKNTDLASSPKDAAKLEGHLKSPDFFAVEQHPTANLKITSVKALKPAKAGDATHEVTGDLTIKGKTAPVTFPLTVAKEGEKTVATGVIAFDRSKYDVRYGSDKFFDNLGNKVISDEIKLDVKVVATK